MCISFAKMATLCVHAFILLMLPFFPLFYSVFWDIYLCSHPLTSEARKRVKVNFLPDCFVNIERNLSLM